MSGIALRVSLIVGVLVYFVLLIHLLRKRTLTVQYSILWFAMGVVMLALAAFPRLLTAVASLLGFEVASNGLFSVLFLLVLLILLSLSSAVSRQQKQIKELAQKLALMEKQLPDGES